MPNRTSCVAAALLTATFVLTTAQSVSAQSSLEAVVDSIAHEYVDAGQLAGMSVAVTRGADTLLFKAYGYADLEWDVPMPTDAIHEIGSVTKQFTSAAMMQLWADGKIDLDADITTYLPNYDTQGRSIPLRRLFDHTSGIKGYTEMPSFGSIMTQTLPRDSLVAMFAAEPLEFEPGHAVIYNNSAYFLLGFILESVSGQSYDEYLEEHVFPKAGMDDTSYCTNGEVWEGRARGYQAGPNGLARASYIDHTWPYAGGSLCSTIGDLVSWNRALHSGRVVTDEAYDLLTTPVPLADGTPIRYAMGITNYVTRSGRMIGHGGGIPGFLSESRYYPDEDVVVVVLHNTLGLPGPSDVADAIASHLFGTDHGPKAQAYAGDLTAFEGQYRGPARGSTVTVTVKVDGEALDISGPLRETAEYLDGMTFFSDGSLFVFEGRGARPGVLRVDQVTGHYVLTRVDEGS